MPTRSTQSLEPITGFDTHHPDNYEWVAEQNAWMHPTVAAMVYSDTYDNNEPSSSDEKDRRHRNWRKDKSRAAGGNDKPNWPELGPPGQASYPEAVSMHGYDTRHTCSTMNWAPGLTDTNNVLMPQDEAEWDQWVRDTNVHQNTAALERA
ncbi:hypothetical protein BDN71DRAFT_1512989 [Pleurotus eryngii]|uniref:Uncharacterized protein n=1 Tax=Pleurotus eryngii TaxID=5323 RepID=A0A9P5ZLH8_PLEER|nr:hypothetical protein BDN71DRAFT_1512989 [Pleurotus eryngii]